MSAVPHHPAAERFLWIASQRVRLQPIEVERIIDLRHRVLRAGLPRQEAMFDRDKLPGTLHFAAVVPAAEDQVIGCATFHPEPHAAEAAWRLRGMATDADARGKGMGRALLTFAETVLQSAEPAVRLVWCNARVPAVRFYQSLGWEVVSGEFEVPTAGPHHVMIKRL